MPPIDTVRAVVDEYEGEYQVEALTHAWLTAIRATLPKGWSLYAGNFYVDPAADIQDVTTVRERLAVGVDLESIMDHYRLSGSLEEQH